MVNKLTELKCEFELIFNQAIEKAKKGKEYTIIFSIADHKKQKITKLDFTGFDLTDLSRDLY